MDLPAAKPPVDVERQRAELALMAAAPLQANRKAKPRPQHDASDLALFKAASEPSLFDAAPTPKAKEKTHVYDAAAYATRWREARGDEIEEEQEIAEAEADAERGFEGYADEDENERGEVIDRTAQIAAERAAYQLENNRIGAIVEAEIAAGRAHWLKWGEGRFGKAPYWTLQLVERDGETFCREEMELHNTGSFGCWRSHGQATIEAVKLELLGRVMRECAKEIATDHDVKRAKQCEKLARWIIDENPPLLSGVDFAAQLERDIAMYQERERLRCIAIRAGAKSYVTEDGRELSIYSL